MFGTLPLITYSNVVLENYCAVLAATLVFLSHSQTTYDLLVSSLIYMAAKVRQELITNYSLVRLSILLDKLEKISLAAFVAFLTL